mmetsp:Transcript_91161/g.258117  ORF Transcript_91161/g.258117 Transcript_91161/m.258117 type:complete len:233 (-) Transcript_91161:436-1134(-)
MLQTPQCTQGRPVKAVVDHEVMDKEPPSRPQGLQGIGVKAFDDLLWHGPGDVGHEHDVEGTVVDGPRRRARVQLHEAHAVAHVLSLLRPDRLAGAAHLGQLQDRGPQARGRPHEHVGEGAGAASDVKHRRDAAELELLLDEVLGGRDGPVVLSLGVGPGHVRVRKPARVARCLAGRHHVRQRAHALVELPANLVAQVIPVELARGGDHVPRRVGGQRVEPLRAPIDALDRCK